jgi:hypothetical protein
MNILGVLTYRKISVFASALPLSPHPLLMRCSFPLVFAVKTFGVANAALTLTGLLRRFTDKNVHPLLQSNQWHFPSPALQVMQAR